MTRFSNYQQHWKKGAFLIACLFCLSPLASAPIALALGMAFTFFIGHPFAEKNSRATQILLQVSVVGLGFGMNLTNALEAGKDGLLLTVTTIATVLVSGYYLGKALGIDQKIHQLIAVGTAICGGSAIATISPVIKAKEAQISVALGIVFTLNAIALFVFPWIGGLFAMSEAQFGLWCAIAIHDTSSVVAASSSFGAEALEVATTVKLARALWIIPLAFLAALTAGQKGAKIKIPYFIALFVLAMVANTYLDAVQEISGIITYVAKSLLILTLFLIGSGLNFKLLKSVGFKPFVHGSVLWVLTAATSLWAVLAFF